MKRVLFAMLALCISPALLAAINEAPSALDAPPLAIGDCHLDYTPGGLLPLAKTVGPLHITFTNDSKQDVVEARFDVNLDGRHVEVRDEGKFSPDVEIKHLFRQLSGGEHFLFSRQAQPACTLAEAKFADGTEWIPSKSTAPASPAPQATDASPYARFLGAWSCSTAAGSAGTMDFTTAADGLALHAAWKNGTAGAVFDHTFTAAPDGHWTTAQHDAANPQTFEGTSPGFEGAAISFTGTERNGTQSTPQRETFRFTSDDAFEHMWYGQSASGEWQPNSYAECTKVST